MQYKNETEYKKFVGSIEGLCYHDYEKVIYGIVRSGFVIMG
jgi:hypothetical protein